MKEVQKQQQQNAASSPGMAQCKPGRAKSPWSQNCNAVVMIFLRLRKIEKDEISNKNIRFCIIN